MVQHRAVDYVTQLQATHWRPLEGFALETETLWTINGCLA